MKTRTLIDHTYNSRVMLVWDVAPEKFNTWVRRKYDPKYDGDMDFVARTLNYVSDGTQLVIVVLPEWRRKNPYSISILVHELMHATAYVLQRHDVELTDETEEAWAYFLDSLVRRSLESLP